jgi:hypothetical protein
MELFLSSSFYSTPKAVKIFEIMPSVHFQLCPQYTSKYALSTLPNMPEGLLGQYTKKSKEIHFYVK